MAFSYIEGKENICNLSSFRLQSILVDFVTGMLLLFDR